VSDREGMRSVSKSSHGPVVCFAEEKPFLSESTFHHRLLPDIVAQATLDFFYKD
jgi:hypothetical protein